MLHVFEVVIQRSDDVFLQNFLGVLVDWIFYFDTGHYHIQYYHSLINTLFFPILPYFYNHRIADCVDQFHPKALKDEGYLLILS